MASTATASPRLGFCITERNHALGGAEEMPATPKGLSDEKAARIMAALREGRTLREFGVKPARLEAYFTAHPEYAREARPLIEANARAAQHRKGARLRKMTQYFCLKGLHPMIGDNVRIDASRGRRACLACRKAAAANPPLMKPAMVEAVRRAFERGGTVNQIIHGRPVGGGSVDRSLKIVDPAVFYRYRRENPEFDRFIADIIVNNNSRGQKLRYQRARNVVVREQNNDYYKIRAMLPANFPDKDDVVSDIFEALLDGSLRREDVRARVSHYVAAYNRMFPTKFAKFGDSKLVSLDEVLFEGGVTTRGDTISRGLWD
jgi:hypothetical protein